MNEIEDILKIFEAQEVDSKSVKKITHEDCVAACKTCPNHQSDFCFNCWACENPC